MPWYWILIIISAVFGPFEAMHALNKARRRREEALRKQGMERPENQPVRITSYIWDLDGTLLDSYGAIVSSLAELAGEYHVQDSYGEIMKTVKQGSVTQYVRGLSEKCGTEYRILFNRYHELSHARTDMITLIPGAAETLRALKEQGAEHFVYTHRGKTSVPLLERLGLKDFFTEIVTSEFRFQAKPSGEGVEYLADKYSLAKENTAYVGDRTIDVYCAKDAGVKAILYLPEDSCVTPTGREDRIIRRLEELAMTGKTEEKGRETT